MPIWDSDASSAFSKSCMPNRPICSVMMATYRPSAYFCDQVASVFCQEGAIVRLLISDDSEDKSLLKKLLADASLQANAQFIDQVDVINGPRLGLASANFFNLVLNNPHDSEFYAFADQDDIWGVNKIAEAIDLLEKSGSDCYSSELYVWKDSSPVSRSPISHRWRIKRNLFGLFFAESAGCTYLMTRKAFLSLKERLLFCARNQLLHILFSHDLFTSAYLHAQGFKWWHDKRSMIYYRQHCSNAWGARVLTIDGLQKRLNLLNGHSYYSMLYLSWMGSARGTIAFGLWEGLHRFGVSDRINLLRSACNAVSPLSLKLIGLLLFALFSKKYKFTFEANDRFLVS